MQNKQSNITSIYPSCRSSSYQLSAFHLLLLSQLIPSFFLGSFDLFIYFWGKLYVLWNAQILQFCTILTNRLLLYTCLSQSRTFLSPPCPFPHAPSQGMPLPRYDHFSDFFFLLWCLRTSCEWTHIICILLSLPSFPWHNVCETQLVVRQLKPGCESQWGLFPTGKHCQLEMGIFKWGYLHYGNWQTVGIGLFSTLKSQLLAHHWFHSCGQVNQEKNPLYYRLVFL